MKNAIIKILKREISTGRFEDFHRGAFESYITHEFSDDKKHAKNEEEVNDYFASFADKIIEEINK